MDLEMHYFSHPSYFTDSKYYHKGDMYAKENVWTFIVDTFKAKTVVRKGEV